MYRFIIRYKRMNAGDSPSRREIMAGTGLPSVSMVQHHLVALERAGLIQRPRRGQARRIAIPGASWEFDEIGRASDPNKCAVTAIEEPADSLEEKKVDSERIYGLEPSCHSGEVE